MNRRHLPYPVLAACWAAVGVYLIPHLPWYCIIAIAAGAVTLSFYHERAAVALLACCVGLWAAQVPGISRLQYYLPFGTSNASELSGTVLNDSRQAESGNYWFRIHLDEVLDSQGQGGQADFRITVLSSVDPLVSAGQQITVTGRFTSDTWFRASEIYAKGWNTSLNAGRSGLRRLLRQELRLISLDSAGLAEALLMGSTDSLDPEMHALFRTNGLLHILALSGMHLGILIAAPCMFLRKIVGLKVAVLIGMVLMILLLFFIGIRSSLLRAGLFFALSSIWLMRGRKPQALVILCQCFLVLLVFFPGLLHETGFQLSFAAVSGILIIAPPLLSYMMCYLPRLTRPLYAPLAAGFAASVAGLPIVAMTWGVWYPIGILLTLLVVPAVSLLMYSCILLVFAYVGLLPPFMTVFFEMLVSSIVRALQAILQVTSGQFELKLIGATGHALWITVLLLCAVICLRWHKMRIRLCEGSCITVN